MSLILFGTDGQSAPRLLTDIFAIRRQDRKKLELPLLFIQATKDHALPPSMSQGMEEYCTDMTRRSVATSHWALWEAPEEVNGFIMEFLTTLDSLKSSL